jgi:aminoglycoside phosphotransferase family enzyme/predicted kinase
MNQNTIRKLLSTLVGDDTQLLETHISWVLLAGEYAWKIKKPVDFGFLDFSSLEKRRFYCEEELRLNSRLAPDIYLQVVPVCGPPDAPQLGGAGDPQDYAVKMRRFDQSGLLSNRLTQLTPELMDELAGLVAAFHQQAEVCGKDCEHGVPESVLAPMLDNFSTIRELGQSPGIIEQLAQLETWTRTRAEMLTPLLEVRKRSGFIRECHGDMHLGNITLIHGRPVLFDGIEFNPELRWIDTMNEIAFLLMDLQEKRLPELAWHFLNRYLQETGDYQGLALCGFYQAYRAMVRAKVAALDGNQQSEFGAYLQQAQACTGDPAPRLMITHGLSGSGKSYTASRVADQSGAVHVRSDVERKRLAGLAALSSTGSTLESGIYARDKTTQTYQHLLRLAESVLKDGYSVIVDATFLLRQQRQMFQELADQQSVPFVILDMQTPESLLRQRIRQRQQQASDPSEADEKVLQLQLQYRECLSSQEIAHAIAVAPDQAFDVSKLR